MEVSTHTNLAPNVARRRISQGQVHVFLLGIGLLVGLGTVLIVGLFALTQPVVDASEEFLAMLGQGKLREAYASAANGLRAQHDEVSFTRAVQQLGLTNYASASWYNREIHNQDGLAEGILRFKNGDTTHMSVRLVKEKGKWMVVGIRCGGVEMATGRDAFAVPSEVQLCRMVKEALLDFNQAIQAGDFSAFYGQIAGIWKEQTTPERLLEAFREFHDRRIDIRAIKDLQPQFSQAATVNESGVLAVAGHYDTEPSQVRFELKYVNEASDWKLMSISVSVGTEGTGDH
jgi:hypothetical protein